MCLAIPGKILEIQQDAQGVRLGKTNFGGIVKNVCLEYTPDAQCGDYVLVHVGFALSTVDAAEAERTYKALEDMRQLGELETPEFSVESESILNLADTTPSPLLEKGAGERRPILPQALNDPNPAKAPGGWP
jgi:hydrogenase expression/formation protein HypC